MGLVNFDLGRRKYLAGLAGVAMAGMAGCSEGEPTDGNPSGDEPDEPDETDEPVDEPTKYGLPSCSSGDYAIQVFSIQEVTRVGADDFSISLKNLRNTDVEISRIRLTGAGETTESFVDDENANLSPQESAEIILEDGIPTTFDNISDVEVIIVPDSGETCY